MQNSKSSLCPRQSNYNSRYTYKDVKQKATILPPNKETDGNKTNWNICSGAFNSLWLPFSASTRCTNGCHPAFEFNFCYKLQNFFFSLFMSLVKSASYVMKSFSYIALSMTELQHKTALSRRTVGQQKWNTIVQLSFKWDALQVFWVRQGDIQHLLKRML